jgi:N-methyl-L-tryptophan oxidase
MKNSYDAVIIGGGIVGLLTAYRLAKLQKSVLVIEKNTIGNKRAASGGLTRSLRNDYEGPLYSKLARRGWDMWAELERELDTQLVIKIGCLNICNDSLATDPYARQSAAWYQRDNNPYREFFGDAQLQQAFGQFSNIDYAVLDEEAGIGLARKTLLCVRDKLNTLPTAIIRENVEVTEITPADTDVTVRLSDGSQVLAKKLVVAAGLGTPALVQKIPAADTSFTLIPDRPTEYLYYRPADPSAFTADKFPVFANLDVGLYGHPIVPGVTKAVKIGVAKGVTKIGIEATAEELANDKVVGSLDDLKDFVKRYMPKLAADSKVSRVTDTDLCSYDQTTDRNFILGALPGAQNVIVACGFSGTGYKFSPVTSDLLCKLVTDQTLPDDISAFSPARFSPKQGDKL